MADVFVAHVEEDAPEALEIALVLEQAGYSTWAYEVDSIPGSSYLIRTRQEIDNFVAGGVTDGGYHNARIPF